MIRRIREYFEKRSDKKLSDKIINRLKTIPKDEWFEIYDKFNGWEFPIKFYDLIPSFWRVGIKYDRPHRVLEPVLNLIKKYKNMELLRATEASRKSKEKSIEIYEEMLGNEDNSLTTVIVSINEAISKGERSIQIQLSEKDLSKIKPILRNFGYVVSERTVEGSRVSLNTEQKTVIMF